MVMIFPSISGYFSNNLSDAKTFAPDDIPTNNPFSFANLLALSFDSSVDIIIMSSTSFKSTKNFEPSPDVVFNTAPRSVGRSAKLLPDTSHALNEYGLSVFTPLDEAVKLTAQWHQMMQNK